MPIMPSGNFVSGYSTNEVANLEVEEVCAHWLFDAY